MTKKELAGVKALHDRIAFLEAQLPPTMTPPVPISRAEINAELLALAKKVPTEEPRT